MARTVLEGGCHCGVVAVRFATAEAVFDLPLLACQCSFCRKHGTRATADPLGEMTIMPRDTNALNRYEFNLKTAQYLVCRHCGVYLGAVCAAGDGERALVNVNCLADQSLFDRTATPVDYAGETLDARLARRQRGWTPVRWR